MPTTAKSAAPHKSETAESRLDVGDRIPDFSMPATGGATVSAAALRGKPFVLYFYPKDDTSGCTAESCDFRDALPDFARLGGSVIGVSRDTLAKHEKFKARYGLNFPLASDETGAVTAQFGVWVEKSMYGKKYMGIERSTFLIDGEGIIRAAWRKVSVPGHVQEVKAALEALRRNG